MSSFKDIQAAIAAFQAQASNGRYGKSKTPSEAQLAAGSATQDFTSSQDKQPNIDELRLARLRLLDPPQHSGGQIESSAAQDASKNDSIDEAIDVSSNHEDSHNTSPTDVAPPKTRDSDSFDDETLGAEPKDMAQQPQVDPSMAIEISSDHNELYKDRSISPRMALANKQPHASPGDNTKQKPLDMACNQHQGQPAPSKDPNSIPRSSPKNMDFDRWDEWLADIRYGHNHNRTAFYQERKIVEDPEIAFRKFTTPADQEATDHAIFKPIITRFNTSATRMTVVVEETETTPRSTGEGPKPALDDQRAWESFRQGVGSAGLDVPSPDFTFAVPVPGAVPAPSRSPSPTLAPHAHLASDALTAKSNPDPYPNPIVAPPTPPLPKSSSRTTRFVMPADTSLESFQTQAISAIDAKGRIRGGYSYRGGAGLRYPDTDEGDEMQRRQAERAAKRDGERGKTSWGDGKATLRTWSGDGRGEREGFW